MKYKATFTGTIELEPIEEKPTIDLDGFWARILAKAPKHAAMLSDTNPDFRLSACYWDGIEVWRQIAEKDAKLGAAKLNALKTYRDEYIIKNSGKVPGYWTFAEGLATTENAAALKLLATNGAFCRDRPEALTGGDLRDYGLSLLCLHKAEGTGFIRNNQYGKLVTAINAEFDLIINRKKFVKPFYIAVAARALITAGVVNLHRLEPLADLIWELWDEKAEALKYISAVVPGEEAPNPAPDLNMMVAPLYAYLGDYDRSDKLFNGARQSWLDGVKQFNQQMWWLSDFVKWRLG